MTEGVALPILSLLAGAVFGLLYLGVLWGAVRLLTSGRSVWLFAALALLRAGLLLGALWLAATTGATATRDRVCPAGLRRRPSLRHPHGKSRPSGAVPMEISPDTWILYEWRGLRLNATIVFTWGVMALLVLVSWAITARLSEGETVSRWQVMLEVVVTTIRDQIDEVGAADPARYLPFIGTLFLFIATANLLTILPGYQPPTGSLSTTAALAICVLIAVPLFSITRRGLGGYLKSYLQPTPFMLPFNLIGTASRTIALAVRLYGNVMSGTVIVGILISVAPFFFPVLMQLLGLLTGLIQAYIFAILAMVYIASASRSRDGTGPQGTHETTQGD